CYFTFDPFVYWLIGSPWMFFLLLWQHTTPPSTLAVIGPPSNLKIIGTPITERTEKRRASEDSTDKEAVNTLPKTCITTPTEDPKRNKASKKDVREGT
ncbi:hypothetical protein ACJX0J_026788, partial [Zea mays]